jgi:hypothetical protein
MILHLFTRRRYEDNVKMGLMDIVWKDMNWIHLNTGLGLMVGSCEHNNEL